jgi:homoserine O-acetyltransferase
MTTLLAVLLPCLTFAQEIRFLEFDSFKFESGVSVPNVKLAYQIRGALNEDKSNAILLPSHYAANHTGYDILIGADKELDPSKYCLILTNMFANGVSSSPNNTPAPFNGPKFPRVSIRDNSTAQRRLIRETLGIAKLKAIVGFSMGGQQAFQWAVSHPDMMDSIVVICGNAKQYPFGIVRLQGSITAIKADDDFKDGNYSSPPEKGLAAFEMHYRAWSRAPAAWPRDLFDKLSDEELEATLESFAERSRAGDANNLLSQAETWKRHDVGDTPGHNGNLEAALRSIRAKVLLMPSTTDQYFPMSDSEFESRLITDVDLRPIQSLFGHSAGADPDAAEFIDEAIRRFLNDPTGPTHD